MSGSFDIALCFVPLLPVLHVFTGHLDIALRWYCIQLVVVLHLFTSDNLGLCIHLMSILTTLPSRSSQQLAGREVYSVRLVGHAFVLIVQPWWR